MQGADMLDKKLDALVVTCANGLGDIVDEVVAQLPTRALELVKQLLEKPEDVEGNTDVDHVYTICQLEQEADELTQLVGELYRERDQAKAEYNRLASINNNPVKENTMATITLDIETMNVDSLGAKMQGVIIRAEVPNSDLPAFLTLVSKLTTNKESHVCKCEASNGDKRPQTSNVD